MPSPALRRPPLTVAAPSCAPDFARGRTDGVRVTVGIPCYNRPELLAETLASIAAQTEFTAFEVVVSDDGATAENRRVVEASGVANVRYYANRTALGPVQNWNRCLALAAGTWVTILHEDDLLYPWFLRTIAPRLRDGVAAVCTRCVQGPTPPPLSPPAHVRAPGVYAPVWFLKGSMTPFPGVVVSRDLAYQLGGFNPAEGGLADYDFWYRLACTGPIELFREPAAFYRVNPGQWTEREWPTMLRRAHALRLRIAREQLPQHPRLGRWIARFYTSRMARAYARRFAATPAALQLERIACHRLPSGWVWALLRWLGRGHARRVGS